MSHPLQVLIVEDSENDATLMEIELQRAGYQVNAQRVETREAMSSALARQRWDLVIADYVMPRFNGLEALAVVKTLGLDLPFIVVSGHITDNTAVAAMKAGAHDYVMKDNLARLGPAVQRELREAEIRRERRRADEKLKVEQVFREAIENSVPSGITAVDLDGRQSYVNPAFCAMVGWTEKELLGAQPPFVYWPPEELDSITDSFTRFSQGSAPAIGVELRFCRKTGERIDVLVQLTPLKNSFGNITGWVSAVSDITERKRAERRLAAEHGITRILAQAQGLAEAARGTLQVLLESLEMELGGLWVAQRDSQPLKAAALQLRSESAGLKHFLENSQNISFAPGEGLPGRVWKERQPLWLADLVSEPSFERSESAARAGLKSAIAFPIHTGQEIFGVVECFSTRRIEPEPALINMITAIGHEIGQFVHRRLAEEALRKAHDELELRVQQRTAELKSANAKLHASIAERKRLENELLEITEKERRRIGLDLHDDLGQKLSGIALMTKGLELKLAKTRAEEARDATRIHQLVQETMNHASDLAHELASLEVAQKDLPSALGDLAAHARELFGISCKFSPPPRIPPLEPGVVMQLYKIAQEAVTNAIKHGKAKKVDISLSNGSDKLTLTVENNGLPFPDLRSKHTGMGLRIMNYRASLIGASLDIKAAGARGGTLVVCSMPLETKGALHASG